MPLGLKLGICALLFWSPQTFSANESVPFELLRGSGVPQDILASLNASGPVAIKDQVRLEEVCRTCGVKWENLRSADFTTEMVILVVSDKPNTKLVVTHLDAQAGKLLVYCVEMPAEPKVGGWPNLLSFELIKTKTLDLPIAIRHDALETQLNHAFELHQQAFGSVRPAESMTRENATRLQDERNALRAEAIGAFQQVFKASSDTAIGGLALSWVARAHREQADYQDAITVFEDIMKRFPDTSEAKKAQQAIPLVRGLATKAEERGKKINECRELVKKDPQSDEAATALYALGQLYMETTYHDLRAYFQAIDSFQEIIGNYPKAIEAPLAYERIGWVYFTLRQFPKAIEAYESLVRTYPKSSNAPEALLRVGKIHQGPLHDSEKARETFKRIILDFPHTLASYEAKKRINEMQGGNAETSARGPK